MLQYFILYKPYAVLSQFTGEGDKKTLKELTRVGTNVYPVGRLDYDSEGLLLLTNDKSINHQLLDPQFKHEREYWVEVEGSIDETALAPLQKGVLISHNGKSYRTREARAFVFEHPPDVHERNPPVRFRKNIPTSWIRLVLNEGKNRQVRKMTAAIGFPTLRLIRYRIQELTIDGLQPAGIRELSRLEAYHGLFGKNT